jgi:16S rRNA processing protein RimM
VAALEGIDSRELAAQWINHEVAVRCEQLLPLNEGEYYWADLIGLRVVTKEGVELGQVERLLETGANDVLVVQGERERLIPFLTGLVVKQVDLAQGLLTVDWDPDF